jgi:uncharacterized protein
MTDADRGTTSAEVVTHYHLRPGQQSRFAQLQASLSVALLDAPGYQGSDDHVARHDTGLEWTVVSHFATAEQARSWQAGPALARANQELVDLLESPPASNVLLEPAPPNARSALVVTSRVRPGSEGWFVTRQGQMQAAQAHFPGYVGQRDQAPIPGVNPNWVSVVAFDNPEHLRAWVDSPQRAQFLADTGPHVESYDCRPAASAFESWFTASGSLGPPPPARKLNAIVLLVLYPVVMVEILWLNPLLARLGLSLTTFIGNVVSVAVTGFVLIPIAARALNWWLVSRQEQQRRINWRGGLLLLACYAACVAFFQLLTYAIGA